MPKKYEAIHDRCIRKGGSSKRCKAKAARIYIGTSKNRSAAARSLRHGRKR